AEFVEKIQWDAVQLLFQYLYDPVFIPASVCLKLLAFWQLSIGWDRIDQINQPRQFCGAAIFSTILFLRCLSSNAFLILFAFHPLLLFKITFLCSKTTNEFRRLYADYYCYTILLRAILRPKGGSTHAQKRYAQTILATC